MTTPNCHDSELETLMLSGYMAAAATGRLQ